MGDPRLEAYARLLVERCVNVQPGWQVVIQSSPLARPLLEEAARAIARRGAYVLPRINFESIGHGWIREAPEELLTKMAPLELNVRLNADAFINIDAPENTREAADIPPARLLLARQAGQPVLKRFTNLEVPWVACVYPTPALAQDAGMSLKAYEDFIYGACLQDWDEVAKTMQRIADRFDRADLVRIVGHETDITMSLKGRKGHVDDGHVNMPGGEVFYCPVEDSVEGVISYSEFPAVWGGQDAEGVRLVFQKGKVVEASARRGEALLIKTLDTDPGARFLGELGIGCNPGVQRHMRNTLFDEKIDGTIHLAVGRGFPWLGGTNESAVHWDMVKDLRTGGRIYCDGELVQENGKWLI